MILDFSNCKTKEDVEKVFEASGLKKQLDKTKKLINEV